MSRTLEPSPSWFEIDPAFYAHGGSCFSDLEAEYLGEVGGLRVLAGPVTPENRAEEALSLANLGARVTAWALDEAAAAPARRLAAEAGTDVAWEFGDLEAIAARAPAAFDLLYHGWSGLDAVDDFDAWARHAAALLQPGGRLYLYDRHPFARVVGLHKGLLVISRAYFRFRDGDNPWTLADLLSALADAGFALDAFEEIAGSERYRTDIDRLPGLNWEQRFRVPSAMIVTASLAFQPQPVAEAPAPQ